MQEIGLDELDQRLVHALQLNARASWSALAPIIGADAVTLARRWARLRDEGIVYTSAYGGAASGMLALIEIECSPGETLAIAEALTRDEEAFTIDLTAGGRDILSTLAFADASALADWTLERIQGIPGIRTMRTHLVSHVVTDASAWRMRALTAREADLVEAIDRTAAAAPVRLTIEQRTRLVSALAEDGRMPASEIAARVGISPKRVRDALVGLRAAGSMAIRVDVARVYTPWPIYAWYFLQVPAAMVSRIASQLGRLDEVRLVVNTVGEYNVAMAVWLRTLGDVGRLEATLEERLPGVTISDRSVVLRTPKHLGHLLDRDGRAIGEIVPMPLRGGDVFSPPTAAAIMSQ